MVHFASGPTVDSGLVSHIQNGYDDESIRLDLIRDYTRFGHRIGLQAGLNDGEPSRDAEI